jgi:hypothetical protein
VQILHHLDLFEQTCDDLKQPPELITKLEMYIERRYGEYGLYTPYKRQKVIFIHKIKGGVTHAHLQVTVTKNDSYMIFREDAIEF